ncbi:hypothetical protein LIA77_06063 [Sarocladium implicatum]|nr:hypothetical protein LIA77_06063 [Sarocladium implicatum]
MSQANASSSESTRRDYSNEWWLVILTTSRRGVKEYDVRVQEDTGTPVNWVHPDVGHKPGVAADGTVLQSIEIAVEKHVKAKPTIRMKEMLLIVEDFPVVRADGRQICPYYLDDCIHHFSRASDDESHSGGSVAASLEQTEARSAILSREGSQRTAPTSTELEQPSTLALDDLTRHIELVLSNDVSRPVTSALRNGFKSYISPNIIERHHLNVVGTNPEVSIELRCQINGKTRSRSYRVPRCSFRVRDGLETDLAIGWTVLKQLEKQVGSTEDSWDPNESSEDEEATGGLFPGMRRRRLMLDPVQQVQVEMTQFKAF